MINALVLLNKILRHKKLRFFLTYETKSCFLEALRIFSLEVNFVLSNFSMRSQ